MQPQVSASTDAAASGMSVIGEEFVCPNDVNTIRCGQTRVPGQSLRTFVGGNPLVMVFLPPGASIWCHVYVDKREWVSCTFYLAPGPSTSCCAVGYS